MGYLQFESQPPSNLTTLVIALSGWNDAGDAATRAFRTMVRRLPAELLATMDPEEFYDFTQVRPMASFEPDGARTIHWPGDRFFTWQRPNSDTGLLFLGGTEPNLKWRTYCKIVMDLAEQCGVRRMVTLGASLAAVPHTRPSLISGTATDPEWQSRLEEWGIARRRRISYQGPTGIGTVLREAATERGISHLSLSGRAPHYVQADSNPAVARALLAYACSLLDIRLDLSRLDRAAEEFRVRCDELVDREEELRTYVRRLEQDYDAAAGAESEPVVTDDIDPEMLLQDLEEFLRAERERGGAG